MLSRVIYGTRVALTVAFVAATLAAIFGTLFGLLAGFYRGVTDAAVSRLVEIWMAFPPVLLSILVVAIMGTGVTSVIAAIAIIDWTRFARVVRAETMAQAQADYVTAARTLGFGALEHPVPRDPAQCGAGAAGAVDAGDGHRGDRGGDPVLRRTCRSSSDTPTWGGMIAQGRQIIYQAWWVFAAPLVALFATVLAFNQLGDGLRRALDPVMRR